MQENPLRDIWNEGIAMLVLPVEEYVAPRMYRYMTEQKGEEPREFYVIAVDTFSYSPKESVKGNILVQYSGGKYVVAGVSAERGIGPWLYWTAMRTIYNRGEPDKEWLYSDEELTKYSRRVWERMVSDGWAVALDNGRYRGLWRGDEDMGIIIDQYAQDGRDWFDTMKAEDPKFGKKLNDAADRFFSEKYREAGKLVANARSNDDVYEDWKRLVNMTARELEKFMDEYGNEAGLSRSEAAAQGIRSGRDSARAIIRMKRKKKSEWTDTDWAWARRQVNFIKRMSGMKGDLIDKNGEPTRKYLALLVWGHDPLK